MHYALIFDVVEFISNAGTKGRVSELVDNAVTEPGETTSGSCIRATPMPDGSGLSGRLWMNASLFLHASNRQPV